LFFKNRFASVAREVLAEKIPGKAYDYLCHIPDALQYKSKELWVEWKEYFKVKRINMESCYSSKRILCSRLVLRESRVFSTLLKKSSVTLALITIHVNCMRGPLDPTSNRKTMQRD